MNYSLVTFHTDQTWVLVDIEKVGKERDSKIENFSKKGKGREMEDHFLQVKKMHWDWDGKGKCKSKFLSILP